MLSHTIKFVFLWISLVVFPLLPVNAQIEPNNEVTLNVTVLDKKEGFIKNLTASDFEVFNGKTQQSIKFVIQEDAPVSVGVLFDLSGSLDNLRIRKTEIVNLVENGLIQFVEAGNPSNEYFILGFSEQSKIILDNTQDKTKTLNVLERLSEAEFKNNTAFYDALSEGIEKISAARHQKRVLLLVTDGIDNSSKKSIKDVKRLLREQNIIVYSVSILDKKFVSSMTGMQGQAFLNQICEAAGGWNLFPDRENEIGRAFLYIAEELRNQYKITFDLESEQKAREWHKLKVKLIGEKSLSSTTIRTREGFYIEKKKIESQMQ